MNNIFKNAYFGKPYKTRDDKRAIYHWYDNEHLHAHHLIIEDGDDVDCHDDGKNICNDYPTHKDIVSEWEEHIDEYELDKLANKCYYEMSDIADVNCADVKEAFNRGYRKAKQK